VGFKSLLRCIFLFGQFHQQSCSSPLRILSTFTEDGLNTSPNVTGCVDTLLKGVPRCNNRGGLSP
ncbi:hypothetical protein L9F63_019143, partial [Diploptera punctata]